MSRSRRPLTVLGVAASRPPVTAAGARDDSWAPTPGLDSSMSSSLFYRLASKNLSLRNDFGMSRLKVPGA
eukprot:5981262-Pyramimonas_sp.AAC.1